MSADKKQRTSAVKRKVTDEPEPTTAAAAAAAAAHKEPCLGRGCDRSCCEALFARLETASAAAREAEARAHHPGLAVFDGLNKERWPILQKRSAVLRREAQQNLRVTVVDRMIREIQLMYQDVKREEIEFSLSADEMNSFGGEFELFMGEFASAWGFKDLDMDTDVVKQTGKFKLVLHGPDFND